MTDQIRGLLFDKDGTLFDFHATWGAWANRFFVELAAGDRTLAARVSAKLGYDLASGSFAKHSILIAGTNEQVTQALIEALPGRDAVEVIRHLNLVAAESPQSQAVPLLPLLGELRGQGLRLGVATNDAEAPARAHLAAAGVTHLFDFIAGFDSGYGGKPAPGIARGFCAATGLVPQQVLMIGDSTHDLISGKAAGMTTIAVLTGIAEADELKPYADVILPDIGALPEFLGYR